MARATLTVGLVIFFLQRQGRHVVTDSHDRESDDWRPAWDDPDSAEWVEPWTMSDTETTTLTGPVLWRAAYLLDRGAHFFSSFSSRWSLLPLLLFFSLGRRPAPATSSLFSASVLFTRPSPSGRVEHLERDPRLLLPLQGVLWDFLGLERGHGDFRDSPILDALGGGTPGAGVTGVHTSMSGWRASLNVSLEGTSVDNTGPSAPYVNSFLQIVRLAGGTSPPGPRRGGLSCASASPWLEPH